MLCPNHGVSLKKQPTSETNCCVQTANIKRRYNAAGPTWNHLFSWACCLQKAWFVSGFFPPGLQFSQCLMCVCFCILSPQIYSASVLKFYKCPELRTKEGFWLDSELVKMSGCVVILKNMQTHILKNHIAIAHQFEIVWKMVKECSIIWLLLRTLSQLLQEFLPLQWQCKTILNQNKIKHL